MRCYLVLQVLGKNHVVKSLDKCNFDPIYEYYMAEKEKKKQLTKEVCCNLLATVTLSAQGFIKKRH